jgi:spore maturation protein CgeB
MKIVVFGLSVTSTWGNGHGTTYRALLRSLYERGHDITFFEKDVEWYASNRDLPHPDFCRVILYDEWKDVLPKVRREIDGADIAVAGSYFPDGLRAIDEMLDADIAVKAFYDIDTPITVKKLREEGSADYLDSRQIPALDLYCSFTGGPMLREIERDFGVRRAAPLYCSFDPREYHRFPHNQQLSCDLSYMGTYAPDRQPKVDQLLCEPARQLSDRKFILAGPQYPKDMRWPANVRRIQHLRPQLHAEFYSSSRFTLNVTRRDMVMAGYSPSVRLFEAAACGAAIVSDNWPGLDVFFSPGEEILLSSSYQDIVYYLTQFSEREIRSIGEAAQARVLAEHTSAHRALEFERETEAALAHKQVAANPVA